MATLLHLSSFSCFSRTSNNNANRQAITNKRERFCTPDFTAKLPPPRPVFHPWKQDHGNSATTLVSRQRASTFVVPMLAALLVGTGQPATPALVYTGTVAVSDTEGVEKQPGEDAYLKLIQKIKDRNERNKKAPAPGYTTNERTPREGAERTDREGEAAGRNSNYKSEPVETLQVERSKPPEKLAPAKVEPPKAVTVSEGKSKTHGLMPLFLAQILLFLAASGGTAALLLVDNNEWIRSEKAIEEYLEKARPVAEDVYGKAWKMGQDFATEAKPYVEKAWEATKPVALKAYESSKPLFRQAREKMVKLFEQAHQRVKS